MERITDNVYAATDIRGCNPGYVVTSEGGVVIDTPQLPTKAVAMREEILKKGPIRFLINTEHHIDHIFGDLFFAGLCPVIGHKHIIDGFWTVSSGVDPWTYMKEAVAKDDPSGISLLPPTRRWSSIPLQSLLVTVSRCEWETISLNYSTPPAIRRGRLRSMCPRKRWPLSEIRYSVRFRPGSNPQILRAG